MDTDNKSHWNRIFSAKVPDELTWYQPHLARSLEIIQGIPLDPGSRIIDVGCGDSTLGDDLLTLGFSNLTLLDVSSIALERAKRRLDERAEQVNWLESDLRDAVLPDHYYDLWHDRAVFHFLTKPEERQRYIANLRASLQAEGHVIIASFGPEGPSQCSGLDVMRYRAESLAAELGPDFNLIESVDELHVTPTGGKQQFVYCRFRAKP
jgi:2-polyprenyl-3-methyl-5-hydroxy-6-metoxy-1,4-benzoquinol methylase